MVHAKKMMFGTCIRSDLISKGSSLIHMKFLIMPSFFFVIP